MSASDPAAFAGHLTLGGILDLSGVDQDELVVIRHTFTAGGLESAADLTAEGVLAYTQWQTIGNKLGKTPPRLWLVFIADGGRRSRLLAAYENHGELGAERTDTMRRFDLRPSSLLEALMDRLVIEWSGDAVNWAKSAASAASFPVVEIADPEAVPFPGFDRVLISHGELRDVMEDSRYAAWRTALGSIQGIYLIADTESGQLYVGKADGSERILGRWAQYARDGHGGNIALRQLAGLDPDHARHFQFSILRVFGPSVPSADVDQAEAHYKRALLSRQFGLNRN
ncbi:GIY-YIG nuclease family protein [Nocardioides fonticola]|uniref:GIY-YIG nuclease family protein n=2 Tax=Nocardioides fonticola TaxID=450363 RepID=A0ABP7Y2D5_9ACTN